MFGGGGAGKGNETLVSCCSSGLPIIVDMRFTKQTLSGGDEGAIHAQMNAPSALTTHYFKGIILKIVCYNYMYLVLHETVGTHLMGDWLEDANVLSTGALASFSCVKQREKDEAPRGVKYSSLLALRDQLILRNISLFRIGMKQGTSAVKRLGMWTMTK